MHRFTQLAIQVLDEALANDNDLKVMESEPWQRADVLFKVSTGESLSEMDYTTLARKHKITGTLNDPRSASINGMPTLEGYAGPYFGGKQGGLTVICYEDEALRDIISGKDISV